MRGRQLLLCLGLAAVLVSQIIVVILSLSFLQHANAQIPSFKISQDNNPAQDSVYFASGISLEKDLSYSDSLVHLKGYIINRGSELAELVQVTTTFYNMGNQVIEKDSTYLGDIPPGQGVKFDLTAFGPDKNILILQTDHAVVHLDWQDSRHPFSSR